MRNELRKITENYNLTDIYNCDETGLYWRTPPSKTLATGSVIGRKKSKDRITVLLTCNATGDHKLNPLVIHKYKNPHAIRNVIKSTLPVKYIGIVRVGYSLLSLPSFLRRSMYERFRLDIL